VDEIRFLHWTTEKLEYVDNDYLFVAPRGRGLSDHYMGQSEKDVLEIVDAIKKMFIISKTMIFGFSMGGFGVWRLTFLHPQSFDAGIIGSGCPFNPFNKNNKEMDVRPLRNDAKHIPYLVLHGTEDRAVPFKPVKEFIEQIQKEGFNVTFKVFEGAGHANYDPREAIFKWLEEYG
jgi:dipeptidyl aminopeptidase/acylaminoacyl peptidase